MITEMNCSPTPQWAKDFEREIMTDYNISCTDAILITGKVCKIVREQNKKAYEWIDEHLWDYFIWSCEADDCGIDDEKLLADFKKAIER